MLSRHWSYRRSRWEWSSRSRSCRRCPRFLTRGRPADAVTVCNRSSSWPSARFWPAPARMPRSRSGRSVPQDPVMVRRASPHATTFGRVLAAVDAAALQQTLTGWVLDRCQARRRSALADMRPRLNGRVVVAFDGKALRGARDGSGGQVKVVGVFDHAFGLVLTQAEGAAGGELAAFVPVNRPGSDGRFRPPRGLRWRWCDGSCSRTRPVGGNRSPSAAARC